MKEKEYRVLKTPYGDLIPNATYSDVRKKNRESVTYYEDGSLESVYLEEPQPIETAVGTIDAELITFYPDGTIKRLFPLYGQLSGYWTETEEYELLKEQSVELFGKVRSIKPLCICFFPGGGIKTLTIWPRSELYIDTKYGPIKTQFGFELTEDGRLKSIEPAFGEKIVTEYGVIYPYDPANYRLHAEGNSLCFDENGNITQFKTIKNKIEIREQQEAIVLKPVFETDFLTGNKVIRAMEVSFREKRVQISVDEEHSYDIGKEQVVFR